MMSEEEEILSEDSSLQEDMRDENHREDGLTIQQ